MATTTSPIQVEKELVPYLHFPKEDVLNDLTERQVRDQKLKKATLLGNLNHTKVSIVFHDIHGKKKIETTIWATTENSIVLKKGATIPINRIYDIVFV